MKVKEMEWIEEHKVERYVETDFALSVRDYILEHVKKYNQKDINIRKDEIISEIKNNQCATYFVNEIKTTRYETKVVNKNELCVDSLKLKSLIKDIKDRYIYDEALMQLVNENKLIPTAYNRHIPMTMSNADVYVEVRHSKGSENLYVCLDLLCISEFRVSATI